MGMSGTIINAMDFLYTFLSLDHSSNNISYTPESLTKTGLKIFIVK